MALAAEHPLTSYVKTSEEALIRDTESGALLAHNPTAYENYKLRRAKAQQEKEVLTHCVKDIADIKFEINTLKNLVLAIVDCHKEEEKSG